MTISDEIIANPILRNIQELLENQTAKGLAKYGTTVNKNDYSSEEWIRHAQEEVIDFLVYLEVLSTKLNNSKKCMTEDQLDIAEHTYKKMKNSFETKTPIFITTLDIYVMDFLLKNIEKVEVYDNE